MAKRGFTLVEVLITTALVGVTIVAVMGGLRSLADTESRARTAELLQRMAMQKVNEIGAVSDPATAAGRGDFTADGYPDITWTIDVQPAGLDNLDQVTVATTRGKDTQSLVELMFVPPITGSSGP